VAGLLLTPNRDFGDLAFVPAQAHRGFVRLAASFTTRKAELRTCAMVLPAVRKRGDLAFSVEGAIGGGGYFTTVGGVGSAL